jgi:hypothetical protein
MLTSVEEMVERAERAASSMQREYQQDKFRAFQHVESPFVLIRALARGRGGAAGAGVGTVPAPADD